MNAAEQAEAARRLDASGLRFVKPIRDGAKITGWLPVHSEAVIGRLMQATGWRVELPDPPATSLPKQASARILSLHRDDDG